MTREEAREEQARIHTKFNSTLVIAAAIIVAVRLAREDIALPTPRLISSVAHSISLAQTSGSANPSLTPPATPSTTSAQPGQPPLCRALFVRPATR